MPHINELTFRIEGRPILEAATAAILDGHKVGLVGRNGAGKTTPLKLVTGELAPESGSIAVPRAARIGHVAQEAPGGEESLIAWVLAADRERARLLGEAEHASDPHRIAEIQVRLADMAAHAAPAHVPRRSSPGSASTRPLSAVPAASSRAAGACAWRSRACSSSSPSVLLDEPTNYLDLEGTLWLESYLERYRHTVLIVSHDRDLLNRAVGAILHLDRGRLALYAGGHAFEETRREQQLELKLKKKQDEERRRIQAFIDRFKAKATKAAQAQSRVKALARMQPIAAQVEDRVVPFRLPNPQKPLASPLLRLEGAAVGYAPDRPVLTRLDFRLDHDDRIALLGQNGNGKSTFASCSPAGSRPRRGSCCSRQARRRLLAQHQLEDLDPAATPYDYIARLMADATEAQKRTRFGTFGFGADKADTTCASLRAARRRGCCCR